MLFDRSSRLGRRAIRIGISLAVAAVVIPLGTMSADSAVAGARHAPKPTIVLVHGAWADGSSWSGVAKRLQRDGYPVEVAPNPLRGLSSDAAYLRDYLAGISGPIVLVGHSYGGAVITNAATGNANVSTLVYVDAFIPDIGQVVAQLAGPDSLLAPSAIDPTSVFKLVPYPGAPSGVVDTYVLRDVFIAGFAADLPRWQAAVLAVSQSPTSDRGG